MAAATIRATIQTLKKPGKPAAAAVSHFYFFKSPTVIFPSTQLIRRSMDPLYRWLYKISVEPNYTHDKFMNGAIQAVMLAAINVREQKLDKFREISTEKMTEYLKRRLPELPEDQLNQKLTFRRSQFVNGFIHSSFFSMNNIVEAACASSNSSLIYHATLAFFIDQSGQFTSLQSKESSFDDTQEEEEWTTFPPRSAPSINQIIKKGKSNGGLLVCNLTLSRQVGTKSARSYGRWRITDLNFFDLEFALDKMHTN